MERVFGPSSEVLGVLREAHFTEPELLRKNNGQELSTRLVCEGSGMIGLENQNENQEWSGMFNHYVKVAGAALELGKLLKLNGKDIDLQMIVDTVMLSHSGRRQYDEAVWYSDEVNKFGNAKERIDMGDTAIGLANMADKNLSPKLIEMVLMHSVGSPGVPFDMAKTWNQKLPMYLDFRISQGAMSLEQRFIDLQRGVVAGRYTQEFLDTLHDWALGTEKELFEELKIDSYESLVKDQKNLATRINIAKKLGKLSTESETVELSHEELLSKLQINPEDINDKFLQPERWERYVRRLYINDAEENIFVRMGQIEGDAEKMGKEFPENKWWGQYSRDLYIRRKGILHRLNKNGQKGMDRGIEFYRKLEQK